MKKIIPILAVGFSISCAPIGIDCKKGEDSIEFISLVSKPVMSDEYSHIHDWTLEIKNKCDWKRYFPITIEWLNEDGTPRHRTQQSVAVPAYQIAEISGQERLQRTETRRIGSVQVHMRGNLWQGTIEYTEEYLKREALKQAIADSLAVRDSLLAWQRAEDIRLQKAAIAKRAIEDSLAALQRAEEKRLQQATKAKRDSLAAIQEAEEERQRQTAKAKARAESYKKKTPMQKTIADLEFALALIKAENFAVGGQDMYGFAYMKIVWPGFAQYRRSDQKDILHNLIKIVLINYEGGGHQIEIHNDHRKIAIVEFGRLWGIETEFF